MESQNTGTMGWIKLGRDLLLRTPIFSVFREPHRHNGLHVEVPFLVLEGADWVNILAVDQPSVRSPGARMLWVRQYRVGNQRVTRELPGGGCSGSDGDPRLSAERELLEETGARAARWVKLGDLNPNPALFRNRYHVYLALDCRIDPTAVLGDGSEDLEVEWINFADRYKPLLDASSDHALIAASLALLEARLASDDDIGRSL